MRTKTTRKLFSLLLALALVFTLAPATAFAAPVHPDDLLGEWEGRVTNATGTHVTTIKIYVEGGQYKGFYESHDDARFGGQRISYIKNWTPRPDGTILASGSTWVDAPVAGSTTRLVDSVYTFDGTFLTAVGDGGNVRARYERKPINLDSILGEWEGRVINETGTHITNLRVYREGGEYKGFYESNDDARFGGQRISYTKNWTARPDGTIRASGSTWVDAPVAGSRTTLVDSIYTFDGTILASRSEESNVRSHYEKKSTVSTPPIPPRDATGVIRVFLNGQQLTFDVDPQIINGRTMVPLRAVFEAMGATIEWDGGTQTATATRGNTVVALRVGSNSPTVNGRVVTLDQPAVIVDGRTLAPLRFVAEAFGGTVEWDGGTQTATITY